MQPDRRSIEILSASLNETPFLRERRMAAADVLLSAGTATPSDIAADVSAEFSHGSGGMGEGRFTMDQFGAMKTGMIDESTRAIFERHYGSLLTHDGDPLAARHYALLSRGYFLYVPPGTVLDAPIHLTLTCRSSWAATHLLIIVGHDATVSFFEDLRSDSATPDRRTLWSHAVEIVAGDGAQVAFTSLQATDSRAELWLQQRARLGRGARCMVRNATLGGAKVTQAYRSQLAGDDATSSLEWMFYAKGSERYTLSARNVFDARNGGGEITMKGIAEQTAHVRCDGLIDIGLHGGGTDTYLTQEVLMLDSSAKVDAVPGLEIKTNDVKASHSATVARITEEDLFYFGARGIPRQEARHMFIRGFLEDIAEGVGDEGAREAITVVIEEKMKR